MYAIVLLAYLTLHITISVPYYVECISHISQYLSGTSPNLTLTFAEVGMSIPVEFFPPFVQAAVEALQAVGNAAKAFFWCIYRLNYSDITHHDIIVSDVTMLIHSDITIVLSFSGPHLQEVTSDEMVVNAFRWSFGLDLEMRHVWC